MDKMMKVTENFSLERDGTKSLIRRDSSLVDKGKFWYKKAVLPFIAGAALFGMVNTANAAKPTVTYDKQTAAMFVGKSFKNLGAGVVATKTKNTTIDLLNGMTENGWWYQIGFGYFNKNFIKKKKGSFGIAVEVYNNKGESVFPKGGAAEFLLPSKKAIRNGDFIELNMSIKGKKVIMSVTDINSRVSSQKIVYPLHGKEFISDLKGKGIFTGIMEESYYNKPFFGFKRKQMFILPKRESRDIVILGDEIRTLKKGKDPKTITGFYTKIIPKGISSVITVTSGKIGEEAIILKNNTVFVFK
jgi:hypothetical protein